MNTLKRWIKNIKWLFNHPPTDHIQDGNVVPCEFCGKEYGVTHHRNGIAIFSICYDCYFKAFRKVLSDKNV
jgi:hypothetical protein